MLRHHELERDLDVEMEVPGHPEEAHGAARQRAAPGDTSHRRRSPLASDSMRSSLPRPSVRPFGPPRSSRGRAHVAGSYSGRHSRPIMPPGSAAQAKVELRSRLLSHLLLLASAGCSEPSGAPAASRRGVDVAEEREAVPAQVAQGFAPAKAILVFLAIQAFGARRSPTSMQPRKRAAVLVRDTGQRCVRRAVPRVEVHAFDAASFALSRGTRTHPRTSARRTTTLLSIDSPPNAAAVQR